MRDASHLESDSVNSYISGISVDTGTSFYVQRGDRMIRIIKMLFCNHKYKFVRKLYGDEINAHNGKRDEYVCEKCGMYKWE